MLDEHRLKVILTRMHRSGISREVIRKVYGYLHKAALNELSAFSPGYLVSQTGLPRNDIYNFIIFGIHEGLFEIGWEVACPQCNQIATVYKELIEIQHQSHCMACNAEFDAYSDDNILVSLTVHPALLGETASAKEKQLSHRTPSEPTPALDLITHPLFRKTISGMVPALRQSMKIRQITVMFTDLKQSTQIYNQIGDISAFQMVNDHFAIVQNAIAQAHGTQIKTIGDAVLAIFRKPVEALIAAKKIRREMARYTPEVQPPSRLFIKIGIHTGPALIVNLNGTIDIFGKTVNLGARIVEYSGKDTIAVGQPMIEDREALRFLHDSELAYSLQEKSLEQYGDFRSVYSIVM